MGRFEEGRASTYLFRRLDRRGDEPRELREREREISSKKERKHATRRMSSISFTYLSQTIRTTSPPGLGVRQAQKHLSSSLSDEEKSSETKERKR